MLSNVARAAIRRVGAGAVHPSTNRVFQSIWRIQQLRTLESTESAVLSSGFSFTLRRTLATAATTRATSAKPKTKRAAKKPKKKAAAKPKAKGRPKKVLSAEEKAKLRIRELKAIALSNPKLKPSTSWTVLVSEQVAGNIPQGKSLGSLVGEAATKYKSLSPNELETYNHKANLNKATNETLLKEWIKSHTPEQIRAANNARLLLKKLTGKNYASQLQDDRIPKRIRTEHALFAQDRWASGDLKGVKVTDAAGLLKKEFLELPESERQAYRERASADKERYIREYRAAFNRDPEFVKRGPSA